MSSKKVEDQIKDIQKRSDDKRNQVSKAVISKTGFDKGYFNVGR